MEIPRSVDPFVGGVGGSLYLYKCPDTKTVHLVNNGEFRSPIGWRHICGTWAKNEHLEMAYLFAPWVVFPALRSTHLEDAVKDTKHEMIQAPLCGNCRRSLVKIMREHNISMNFTLRSHWEVYRRDINPSSPFVEQRAEKLRRERRCRESCPHGYTKQRRYVGTPVMSTATSEDTDMTSKILVTFKVEYDLSDDCITNITESVEEIRDKANEYGSVEEVCITSEEPLDVEISL